MDLDYGKQYRLLFERHWWWRAREVVILDELHRLKPDGSWGNILDVGCGDGLFFPRLAENGGAKLDHRAANRSCFWAE